jgi:mannose-6-phosphate isomerase-like protein (cupin superfamily)
MELDVGHPILLVPGEGEVVGDSSAEKRIELLCDRDELHVTWTRMGGGLEGAVPHVHRNHSDLFYVLEGELTFLVGPDRGERTVSAGTLVLVPPLVVHGFRNDSDGEARYLNFHAPGSGFADYLRGRRPGFDSEDPPVDGGRPAEEARIVTAGEGPFLVHRPEIRIEVLDEPGPASDRVTCLYVLPDGRFLEIRA